MDGNPEALVFAGKGQGFPTLIKRAFDVVFSTMLLILLASVFLVTAILVRWTSPGPAFFGQTRVGLNKRQFRMFKFRTMTADAEQIQDQLLALNEMTGPVFKIKTIQGLRRSEESCEKRVLMNCRSFSMSSKGI